MIALEDRRKGNETMNTSTDLTSASMKISDAIFHVDIHVACFNPFQASGKENALDILLIADEAIRREMREQGWGD